jgi:hypothetical protein
MQSFSYKRNTLHRRWRQYCWTAEFHSKPHSNRATTKSLQLIILLHKLRIKFKFSLQGSFIYMTFSSLTWLSRGVPVTSPICKALISSESLSPECAFYRSHCPTLLTHLFFFPLWFLTSPRIACKSYCVWLGEFSYVSLTITKIFLGQNTAFCKNVHSRFSTPKTWTFISHQIAQKHMETD